MSSTFALALLGTLASQCDADLRMSSQTIYSGYVNRGLVSLFYTQPPGFTLNGNKYLKSLYMEPSDFGYQGLKNQRDGGQYDQFLRSNIDNEQDKRDFPTEPGRDHLPFRTWEGTSTGDHASHKRKVTDALFDARLTPLETSPGPFITASPGKPQTVPLRWNNPHASELEVNVWIMQNKYVVPIKKPTCAGEGYQDAAFNLTIPSDFNSLGSLVPGFAGCTKLGDCVLQIYAHSVETRQYALGTPLVVTGFSNQPATAANDNAIPNAKPDPGVDISNLRQLCRPSTDPDANFPNALPRKARLISDVFNHAYQNSDFSPYSGQQPESISQNLQAAALLKMTSGNRGELGKALLQQNRTRSDFQKRLDNAVKQAIKNYEKVANAIILKIGDQMKTKAITGIPGDKNCFRCQEVGSASETRLQTTTYIPSFQVPPNLIAVATAAITDNKYSCLVPPTGLVQIYPCILKDFTAPNGLFIQAEAYDLRYQPPAIKNTLATMADDRQFTKTNAQGQADNGLYAATLAEPKKARAAAFSSTQSTALAGQVEAMDVVPGTLYDMDDTTDDVVGSDVSSGGPSTLSFSSPQASISPIAMLMTLIMLASSKLF